jgi:hypothetical protein
MTLTSFARPVCRFTTGDIHQNIYNRMRRALPTAGKAKIFSDWSIAHLPGRGQALSLVNVLDNLAKGCYDTAANHPQYVHEGNSGSGGQTPHTYGRGTPPHLW